MRRFFVLFVVTVLVVFKPATILARDPLSGPLADYVAAKDDSYQVASKVHDLIVKIQPGETEKIAVVRNMITQHVDVNKIVETLDEHAVRERGANPDIGHPAQEPRLQPFPARVLVRQRGEAKREFFDSRQRQILGHRATQIPRPLR